VDNVYVAVVSYWVGNVFEIAIVCDAKDEYSSNNNMNIVRQLYVYNLDSSSTECLKLVYRSL
jgi:hypothetical protein